jgi:hypothetical protein
MSSVRKIITRHGRPIEVEVITPTTPVRRKVAKLTETWARIPHERGLKLAKQTKCPVLAVLLALEAAVHKARSNRVKLTNDLFRQYGIRPQSKTRGLRQIAATGTISVEGGSRKKASPMVTHHWYTEDGKLKPLR